MTRPPQRTAGRALGFTVVELMVTSALILIVLAAVLPQLAASITNFDNARVRSDTNDAATVALDQIQRDVVSSNVLYQDASGFVHLQVFGGNSPSSSTTVVTTAPVSTCVEYSVSATGVLQRRAKSPAAPSWPSGWGNLMTGVVNSSQAGSPPVFTVTQNRSLTVNLWVNADTRVVNRAKPSQFQSTFTGRAIPDNPSATGGAC